MSLFHRLASMVSWILRRDRAESLLDDEIRSFVEMATADKIRDGVPAAEARRLALIELGGVEQVKERVRAGRHGALLDDVGRDVRYAFRLFARQRTFAIVIVGTLALGIGANTAIFSIVDSLLLRTLADRGARAARAARRRAAVGTAIVDVSDLGGDPAPRRSVRRRVRVEPVRRAVQPDAGRRNTVRQRRMGQRRQLRRAWRQAFAWSLVRSLRRQARRWRWRSCCRDQPRASGRSISAALRT